MTLLLENADFWSKWFNFAMFSEILKSIIFEIKKNQKRNIFSFQSEIECNSRQINNHKHQVPKNDVFWGQLKNISAAGTYSLIG